MTLPASAPASVATSVPHVAASAAHSIPWLPADASWLSIAQGCVPIAIAAMVAWVGWRQLQAARAKLKLDLFEKRLAIFNATWEQVGRSAQNKPYEYRELGLWFNKIHEASFLFGPDIVEYLNEIREKAIEEQILWAKVQPLHPEPATDEQKAEHKALNDWFLAEAKHIQHKFAPYLSFHEWR